MIETNKRKVVAIVKEEVDPRGRYITSKEFRWFMDYFPDPLDPRKLCLAVMYTCGIRLENGVNLRLQDFKDDFSYLHVKQCKPNVRCKDGIMRVKVKPRMAEVPCWLSLLLQDYCKYRLYDGYYVKHGDNAKLFPSLRKMQILQFFDRTRRRFGHKEPWLLDVWYILIRIYDDGSKVKQNFYRVASHACRANFVQTADDLVGHNPSAGRIISGHSTIKDYERYTRYIDIDKLRTKHRLYYMEPLMQTQKTPILKGQKTLSNY